MLVNRGGWVQEPLVCLSVRVCYMSNNEKVWMMRKEVSSRLLKEPLKSNLCLSWNKQVFLNIKIMLEVLKLFIAYHAGHNAGQSLWL